MIKRCGHYFEKNSLVTVDVERFRQAAQGADETFLAFVGRLRRLAELCRFGSSVDREIYMQIVNGSREKETLIKNALVRDLSLAELEAYGMRLEATKDLTKTTVAKQEPRSEQESVMALTKNSYEKGQPGMRDRREVSAATNQSLTKATRENARADGIVAQAGATSKPIHPVEASAATVAEIIATEIARQRTETAESAEKWDILLRHATKAPTATLDALINCNRAR